MHPSFRALTLCVTLTVPVIAQSPVKARSRATEADYAKWETLGNSALSPDGKWVAYDFRKGASLSELRYREVASGTDHAVPRGSTPVFSANSRWLLYTINPDTGGATGGRGGRGGRGGGGGTGAVAAASANRNKLGVVDLSNGTVTTLEDVQSYAVNK